jgi:hypothetical protein
VKLADIFTTIPEDRALFAEDFAHTAGITIPDFNPRYSKVVGTMDGRDVWCSRYFGQEYYVFAFLNKELTPDAFIVVTSSTHPTHHSLERIWASPNRNTVGMPAALCMFVTRKLNIPLMITPDQCLTNAGWNWLIKLAQRKQISLSDGSKEIAPERLTSEFLGKVKTNTAVFFEVAAARGSVFGDGYRTLKENVLYINNPDYES